MRAAAYARYSTDRQQRSSIRYQLDAIRAYCREHEITITATYSDESETGTNMDRPGFQAMMAAAERREFEAVVIYDITRGSRDVGDWFQFRKRMLLLSIIIGRRTARREAVDPEDMVRIFQESVEHWDTDLPTIIKQHIDKIYAHTDGSCSVHVGVHLNGCGSGI